MYLEGGFSSQRRVFHVVLNLYFKVEGGGGGYKFPRGVRIIFKNFGTWPRKMNSNFYSDKKFKIHCRYSKQF